MHGNSNQGGAAGQEVGERLISAGTALLVAKFYNDRMASREASQRAMDFHRGYQPSNLLDDPQYPETWGDYIGQRKAKQVLQDAVTRARERNERVRHVLISCGVPGIGKTALAVLLAREIGTRCFAITGTPTPAQVKDIIMATRPGDVLFIDEIHRLADRGKRNSEWLLHVLQDDALMDGTGMVKGNLGITVVGASTDADLLPEPLLDRFGVRPVLEEYDPADAVMIAYHDACRLFPPLPIPEQDILKGVALAGDCNPRRMRQLLEQAIDMHYSPDGFHFDRLLERVGTTVDGLDRLAQRYLIALARSRGSMGEAQLRQHLQTPNLTYCERRLAAKGLISFGTTGRSLTSQGTRRARELMESA